MLVLAPLSSLPWDFSIRSERAWQGCLIAERPPSPGTLAQPDRKCMSKRQLTLSCLFASRLLLSSYNLHVTTASNRRKRKRLQFRPPLQVMSPSFGKKTKEQRRRVGRR